MDKIRTNPKTFWSRMRSQPVGQVNVTSTEMLGWYLRKGLFSGIRGCLMSIRVAARLPFFVGSGCSISYGRSIQAGRFVVLGRNSVINAYSVNGVVIGDRVTIRENAWVQCSSHPSSPGEGLDIGPETYIGPSVILGIGGKILIGARCQIGSGVTMVAENHAIDGNGRPSATEVTRIGIVIGDDCWIGHRATVLDGVVLGNGCIVGAGAVVTKSFPAGSTIVGVPGRIVGT
jgi:acetyltransferase-like isoleucine patch superfamily enzyme